MCIVLLVALPHRRQYLDECQDLDFLPKQSGGWTHVTYVGWLLPERTWSCCFAVVGVGRGDCERPVVVLCVVVVVDSVWVKNRLEPSIPPKWENRMSTMFATDDVTGKQGGKIFCTQNKNLKRKYIYTSVDGAPRNIVSSVSETCVGVCVPVEYEHVLVILFIASSTYIIHFVIF